MKTIFTRTTVIASLFFAFPCFASASTPSNRKPSRTLIQGEIRATIQKGHSLKSFYESLAKKYGNKAIAPLLEIVNDERASDELRWTSIFALARIAGKESLGMLKKFMTHSSWMLRDAALKSAAALGATELKPQIEQRLKDDALIVRTTAVQTLAHLELKESSNKLVDSLFDPANYHGGKGLWIHKYILQALKEFHYKEAVPKLITLLNGPSKRDETLQAQIVQTLESLTGRSFPNKPLQQQIYLWKRNTLSEVTF